MTFEAIDDTQIDALLAEPEKKPGTRTRKPKEDIRDLQTWFPMLHKFSNCDNPECVNPDKLKRKVEDGNMMVSTVNNKNMCRWCFLAGYALRKTDA